MPSSYTNPTEMSTRARAIELLALESQVSPADVERLYDEELAALKAGAHITKFLSIITSRKVREKLRERSKQRDSK